MAKRCEMPRERARRNRRKATAGRPASTWEPVKGLSAKRAVEEARRCLGARECNYCEICSLFCPDLCITSDETTGDIRIDLDYCKGCGICAAICPRGAIRMVIETL